MLVAVVRRQRTPYHIQPRRPMWPAAIVAGQAAKWHALTTSGLLLLGQPMSVVYAASGKALSSGKG